MSIQVAIILTTIAVSGLWTAALLILEGRRQERERQRIAEINRHLDRVLAVPPESYAGRHRLRRASHAC